MPDEKKRIEFSTDLLKVGELQAGDCLVVRVGSEGNPPDPAMMTGATDYFTQIAQASPLREAILRGVRVLVMPYYLNPEEYKSSASDIHALPKSSNGSGRAH